MKLEPHPMTGASLIEVMDYLALRLAEVRDANADNRNLRNASDRYDEAYMWVVAWVSSQADFPAPAVDADEFATVEEWEHDDQRELSRLYNHKAHDGLQFNRGQMREAIRHGKRLAAPAVDAVPAGEVDGRERLALAAEAQGHFSVAHWVRFASAFEEFDSIRISIAIAAISHGEGRK